MQDLFDFPIAYDPTGGDGEGRLLPGVEFQVFSPDDTAMTTPLDVFDPGSGAPIIPLRSSSVGVLPQFRVTGDLPEVIVRSGSFATRLQSKLGIFTEAGWDANLAQQAADSAPVALAAAAAAEEAKDALEAVEATNDGIMTAVAGDPASAFRAQLSSTLDDITVYVDEARFPGLATDPAATINAVCAAASGRTTIKVAPGEYTFTSGVVVHAVDPETLAPRDVTLDLTGVRVIRDTPGVNLVTLRGMFAPQVAVTAVETAWVSINGVSTPVTNLTYAASHGLARGDFIKLISDDPIPGARITSATMHPRMGQFMMVHSVTESVVTLYGIPVRLSSYVTNVRSAKCYKGSANLRGGTFDLTDAMLTPENRSPYTVRMESLISSRIDGTVIARSAGPAIQLRSNLFAHCDADILWAMNDDSQILGYGVQDSGSNFSRTTGSASWTRHGYDNKSVDVAAGSANTSSYGSSMWDQVSMRVVHSSGAGFSTHQEAYMTRFDECAFHGARGGASAFSLRGYGCTITDPVVDGAGTAFAVFTESAAGPLLNGETREVTVRGGQVHGVHTLFSANIRTGTHPHAGVKDDLRSIDISGVHATGVERTGTLVNARARVADLDIRLHAVPNPVQFALTNADLDIAGTVTIDGSEVTEEAGGNGYRLISTNNTSSPDVSRIVTTGSLVLRGSATYLAGFTAPAIQVNAQGIAKFPRSDSLIIDGPPLPVPPFPATLGYAAILGGYEYLSGGRPHQRSGYRTYATSGNLAAANLWRELFLSPEQHLVAVYTGSIAATVGVLGAGAFLGQLLTIVTMTSAVTINDGVENGTSLGAASVVIPAGESLRLVYIDNVWKKL